MKSPFTGAADGTTTRTGTPGQKAASLPTEAATAGAVAIAVVASASKDFSFRAIREAIGMCVYTYIYMYNLSYIHRIKALYTMIGDDLNHWDDPNIHSIV